MPVLDADGPTPVTLVTTAETVIATLQGVNTRPGGSQVILQGNAVLNPAGVAATALQLRIRRGTTTAGAIVGAVAQEAVAAGATLFGEVQVDDNPGEVAGQSYVLTAQQVAATGNGTVTAANLRAEF